MCTDTITRENVWEIPAANVDAFRAAVDKANARLARNGSAAQFNVTYETFERITFVNGYSTALPYVRCTMDAFRLSIGHYVFVASLVAEENGSATVKDHENYQGTDQTVITRARIAE